MNNIERVLEREDKYNITRYSDTELCIQVFEVNGDQSLIIVNRIEVIQLISDLTEKFKDII